jgi:amino acid adenylation domain-containing protein/non-ribosomal peptide synthase protein (TIGR01720 family)
VKTEVFAPAGAFTARLDDASREVLRQLASDELGEFTIVTAAIALLLSRYLGTPSIEFVTPPLRDSGGIAAGPHRLKIEVSSGATLRELLAAAAERVESSGPIAPNPPRGEMLVWLFDKRVHRISTAPEDCGLRFNLRLDEGVIEFDVRPDAVEPFVAAGIASQLAGIAGWFGGLNRPVAEIQILTPMERQRLLRDFNRTEVPGLEADVVELIEKQAALSPQAWALSGHARQVTYEELNERANRLASHLRRQWNAGPEKMVGVLMDASDSMIVAVLGILKCGAAFVPIDPDCPPERIRSIVQDSGVRLVVTEAAHANGLTGLGCDSILLPEDAAGFPHDPDGSLTRINPRTLAYVLYTSGSTGSPKGCQIERRSLATYVNWANRYYFEDESCGNFGLYSSLAFDFTLTCIFCALTRGKVLRVYPRQDIQTSLAHALGGESGIDVVKLTPSHIRIVELMKLKRTAVRKAIVGGEELTGRQISVLRALNPGMQIYNEYGPTEATVGCIAREIADASGSVLIGTPISNTRAYILDHAGALAPIGARGEICVAGACLARGYLNLPEATAAKFVDNPFVPGERMYLTGDLGRWLPDGSIQCFGRKDSQVKIGGHRVELGEVESVLAKHPLVEEAVVVAREDGENARRLAAYVVAPGLNAADLRRYAAIKLPAYMIPTSFMFLPALPLNRNGKVDRDALPPPDTCRQPVNGRSLAAATPIQRALVAIWCELLELDHAGLGDNFFELGGDSLTAARLISRLWSRFAVEIGIDEVYDCPTLAQLAARIESKSPALSGEGSAPLPAPAPGAVQADARLPFAQQRLWFLAQFEETGTAYNIASVLGLHGKLDIRALERSFSDLVARQDALRTIFPGEGGKAVQRVLPAVPFTLRVTDLSSLPEGERDKAAADLASRETDEPFDLAAGPLFRAALFRVSDSAHYLAVAMHHIISDGWSMNVLVRELCTLYEAHSEGSVPRLPELPIPYSSYGAWQRQRLEGESGRRHLEYWGRHLTGAPELLDLPADRPRPAVQTYRGGIQRFHIPEETAQGLRALARESGASLFMVVLSAWAVLLARYSRQDDLVVGVPVANRNSPELEPVIGLFVNTLPLRLDLTGDPSFRQFLERAKSVALAAFEHQEVPFEQIVAALDVRRDTSHSPLFQVMLAWEHMAPAPASAGGLSIHPVELDGTTAKFDLTLYVEEAGSQLPAALEYNSDLFDPATAARMSDHLTLLLAEIARNPARSVRSIPMVSSEERRQIENWNRTGRRWELRPIHYLIEDRVAGTPGAIAAVCGKERITYAALNERSNRLAHYLRGLGVGADVPVAVAMERSLDMIVALLAILKAGGAYVPIDPEYPAERVQRMMEDCAAPVALTQAHLLPALPGRVSRVFCVDRDWDLVSRESPVNPPKLVEAGHLAYAIFTSGSTGGPKGAMNEHGAVCNRLLWMQEAYGLTAGDRVLQKTPFSFDVSVWELFWPLIAGARLVFAKPGGHRDSRYLVSLIREEGITTLHFVPSMLRVFLEEPEVSSCDSLRRVICSGEALAFDLQERFMAALDAELHNLYGPTEAAVDVTFWHCRKEANRRSVPIGRPIANTRIHIVDEQLEPVAVGVPGELLIGGVAVGRGYLNRPELTAAKFIPDPFRDVPGARLYRTGDLARYRDDGAIEFLGRLDQQVKIRGFRIEPGEVEDALRSYPGVRDCVVLALEERGLKRLAAWVVFDAVFDAAFDGGILPDAEVRTWLKARLPEYMVPSLLIAVPALPLLPNGKLNRGALPVPAPAFSARIRTDLPRNPREETLVRIWREVLGVDHVGIYDNFFGLGGDSILGIQVIARANQAGLHLAPGHLFQHQAIADLAAAAAAFKPATKEFQAVRRFPLTPVQQWFIDQRQEDPGYFNQSVLLRVPAEIDPEMLRRALHAVYERHDALRLRFFENGGVWLQEVVGGAGAQLVSVEDGADMAAAAALAEKRINLPQPLLQARLFRLADSESWRLFIVVHHLVIDAVSWGVLLEDLHLAYHQLVRGERIALPPPTASFEEWAAGLRAFAASPEASREADYWTGSSSVAVPQIPVDSPNGPVANLVSATRHVRSSLSAPETAALLKQVSRAYNTRINDVLLTALALAFREWTGDNRLRIDVEGHGREVLPGADPVDLSRTIGWFTSIYPLTLVTPDSAGLGGILKSVKEQIRRIPNHGLGYGVLRYLSPDEAVKDRLRSLPESRVLFNYLGQVGHVQRVDDGWSAAPETIGSSRGPRFIRSHSIEINAEVNDAELRIDWLYNPAIHSPSTVQSLAAAFLNALRRLIQHCLPVRRSLTPSDVPQAGLGQESLDLLLSRLDPENVEDIYRLSPMQQGMLFHTLLDRESTPYFEQMSCMLDGALDEEALRNAWRRVIGRHSVLRTSFHWVGLEQPVQVVLKEAATQWTALDWRGLSRGEQEARFEQLLHRDKQEGFDLSAGPPMRFALIRTGPSEYRFCWSHHHALLDGWSAAVVLREVFKGYTNTLEDSLPAPYRRHIEWLGSQDRAAAESFWRRQLAGFTAPATFPLPHDSDSTGFGVEEHQLSRGLSAKIQQRAQEHHVSPNSLFMGAWSWLLSRYSGTADVLFGLTVSGRPPVLEDAESMVGLFINTIPARVEVRGHMPIAEWASLIQSQSVQWIEHSHVALVDIQAWSEIARGTPLFDSILVFEDYPADRAAQPDFSGLKVGDLRASEESGYPLTMAVIPGSETRLRARFADARFTKAAARRILHFFETVLQTMTEDMRAAVDTLPPADAPDLRMMEQGNAAGRETLHGWCVHEAFETQVYRTPDALAVVCGAESLSFSQLNRRANRLARYLQGRGVGPETTVALCFERSASMIVALLAVLKAGGAYVPLDPDDPAQRARFTIEDCGARFVLTNVPSASGLPSGAAPAIFVDRIEPKLAELADTNLGVAVRADNLAYVIYTSGTTGRPKGVMIEHRSVSNLAEALHRAIYGEDPGRLRIGLNGPLAFDTSVKQIVQLANGHTLVVVPEEVRLDPASLFAYARAHGLDSLDSTPAQLESWIQGGLLEEPRPAARILVGGEPISTRTWRRLAECQSISFYNVYGPTETTVDATAARIEPGSKPNIGRPLANVLVYVLDGDLQPVPLGAIGELFIGGRGVGRGYRNDAALTAKLFLRDPFRAEPGARMYRTGDRARFLQDGSLEFVGRADSQLKIRGIRIEPGEVESVLEQQAGVQRAVVAAREDGSGLIAYLVPRTGLTLDIETPRRAALAQLPARLVPGRFVILEKLPLTSHGKVDRSALPSPPSSVGARTARSLTPTEQRLLPLWRDILAWPEISLDDNFFELGGHSIAALRLMGRVQQEFGKRLPIAELFRNPTIETLAASLSDASQMRWETLVPIRSGGEDAPLFLAPGVGGNVSYYRALGNLVSPGRPVYGLQAVGLDGVTPPLASVEAIAAHNIREIRKVFPSGPWYLAGHSFGGKVAFEMSQQLRRAGEAVPLLAIFDTPAPAPSAFPRRKDWTDAQWLAVIAYEVGVFLGHDLGVTSGDLAPLDSEEQLALIAARIRSCSSELGSIGEAELLAQLNVYRSNFMIRYLPPADFVPVPIALFQTTEIEAGEETPSDEVARLRESVSWGWQRYSSSAVRVIRVPGNHISMLLEPHVRTLADHLNELLTPARAQVRDGSS